MRVIAGRLGGRKLVSPEGTRTRPTSDRVREALFSILDRVEGAKVLDLFAGTGALGIEALSRGAAHATFVETSRPAVRALRQNLHSLDLEHLTRVLPIDVERAFSTKPWGGDLFDLVFLDPPYAEVRSKRPTGALGAAARGLPSSTEVSARVVLEHASSDEAPVLSGLELEDTRVYGDTALSFYLR